MPAATSASTSAAKAVQAMSVTLPSMGQPTRNSVASLSLPSYQAVEKALAKPAEVAGYRLLTDSQCQCLAAAESTLGNLLDWQRQTTLAASGTRRDREARSRAVLADVLGLRAVEQRNKSAASAMELYYRLAGAYFARDQLDRSIQELQHSIDDFRKSKATGLTVPGDEEKLQTQRIELVDRKVQAESAAAQLNEQLGALLGLERDPSHPLWPGAEMTVDLSPIDVEAAVASGLPLRPDLAMLCVLRENVSEETLGSVRSALAVVDPLLGSSSPKKHMVSGSRQRLRVCLETQSRQVQLDELFTDERRRAEDEIRRAAADAEKRLRQVGLARDKLAECQAQLSRLRQRRQAKGVIPVSQISAAQLEVLRAESDAFQAVIEWKIAMVKLKEAQGLLASECGYPLPATCCEKNKRGRESFLGLTHIYGLSLTGN
jgi:hypothetical protein